MSEGQAINIHITQPPREERIAEHIVRHPCTLGYHRWAWLTSGGQACGYCGVPR